MDKWAWTAILILAGGLGWLHGLPNNTSHPAFAKNSPRHDSLLAQRTPNRNAAAIVLRAPLSSVGERLAAASERSETGASFEIQLLIAPVVSARSHGPPRMGSETISFHSQTRPSSVIGSENLPRPFGSSAITPANIRGNRSVDRVLAREFPGRFFDTATEQRFRDSHFVDLHSLCHHAPFATRLQQSRKYRRNARRC